MSAQTTNADFRAQLLWTMGLSGGVMVKGHTLLPLGDTLAMTRCTHWLAQVIEGLLQDRGDVRRLEAAALLVANPCIGMMEACSAWTA